MGDTFEDMFRRIAKDNEEAEIMICLHQALYEINKEKEMKIIERPMSTTYVFDYLFHLIKDEEEAENVRKLIDDKEIFHVQRTVDMETYQPMLAFAIPEENKPFSEWMKYIAKLELIVK